MLLHDYSSLHKDNYFGKYLDVENTLLLKLEETPVQKLNSKKSIAKVLITNGIKTSGKILLYVDSDVQNLEYGSSIWVKANPRIIAEAKHPYQFDYKRFLGYRNNTHQLFLQDGQCIVSSRVGGSSLIRYAKEVRIHFLSILEKSDWNKDELVIGSALLLGYKNHMNENVS